MIQRLFVWSQALMVYIFQCLTLDAAALVCKCDQFFNNRWLPDNEPVGMNVSMCMIGKQTWSGKFIDTQTCVTIYD